MDELPELNAAEKAVMDSMPDDLVKHLLNGEWWTGDGYIPLTDRLRDDIQKVWIDGCKIGKELQKRKTGRWAMLIDGILFGLGFSCVFIAFMMLFVLFVPTAGRRKNNEEMRINSMDSLECLRERNRLTLDMIEKLNEIATEIKRQ